MAEYNLAGTPIAYYWLQMTVDLTPPHDVKFAGDLAARVQSAADIARKSAAAVDAKGVFPAESFAEIRRQRLLGIMAPATLGGEGVSLATLIDVCFALGQACASTALIYAMHQIKMACLVRHGRDNPAIQDILRRVAREQQLLASSTTEGSAGGNIRSSEAGLGIDGDHVTLERDATVMSYGMEADGIVTTARRSSDAAASNQVLLVLLKADYTLQRTQVWDALGMRGTHSEGFTLRARAPASQVLTDPYEKIHGQTMVPFAHLTWSAVWMGIAAEATAKAQAFVRHALRKSNGQTPPGAAHCTAAVASLRTLRGVLASSLRSYEAVMADEKAARAMEFQTLITLTKVQCSELATATVLSALRACGLSGYRNDTEFSIGRHLRDILSAPLMINNDRIMSNLASASLLASLPASIRD
jgi:acyl-CoA dehydrogenase